MSVLAYGDVKRVELAIALAHRPRLLLMDEPTAGMAPRERNELMALARRLAHEQSIGVLFTEHSMDVVFAHADRIIVLARGELIAEGTPAAVRDDARVREVYFGGGTTLRGGRIGARRPSAMLEVQALDAWYGQAQVLYGVSLAVGAGECVALVGRNGAGKSTTMKAIMGLMARRRGRVAFRGPTSRAARRTASPASASAGCRKTGASSPTSRCARTSPSPASRRATGAPTWSEDSSTRCFPTSPRCPTGRAAA